MELTPPPRRVSTGALPDPDELERLVREAHARFAQVGDGALSAVYPALARVDPGLFGICLVGVAGRLVGAGDIDVPFTIMSVAKPFVFALVCDAWGRTRRGRLLGVNATGLPFNSPSRRSSERGDGRTNPMVNPGAIATTSLVPGAVAEARWAIAPRRALALRRPGARARRGGLRLRVGDERPQPEHRPRCSWSFGRIDGDPAEATRPLHAAVLLSSDRARTSRVMGATLADGGVNPRHAASASSRRDAVATRSR